MAWVKLDDAMPHHPKVMAAGPQAFALDVAAIAYSNRYGTDGFIADEVLPAVFPCLAQPRKHATTLVKVGRWVRDEDRGGWLIHDVHDYQPTAAEVTRQKEIDRRRSAMNANPELREAVKLRDKGLCRYCGVKVNWRDRRGPTGGTYDHVIPVVQGGDDTLENIVTACRSCNLRKGPRTPDQAAMTLLEPGTNLGKTQVGPGPVPGPVPDQSSTTPPTPTSGGAVDNSQVVDLPRRANGTNPRAVRARHEKRTKQLESARSRGRTLATTLNHTEAVRQIRHDYPDDDELADTCLDAYEHATGVNIAAVDPANY